MLFVKNMVFLDGAIASLAPDLDLFAEIESIALMFAQKHGERIVAQLGLEGDEDWAPDMSRDQGGFRPGRVDAEPSPTAKSRPAGRRCARSSTTPSSGDGAPRRGRPWRARRT